MSTSLFDGFLRYEQGEYDSTGDPIDTYYALALANNALHAADQWGQVLVAWGGNASPGSGGAASVSTGSLSGLRVATYHHIVTCGPFDLRLNTDGIPYSVRVQLGGARSGGSGNVTFAVVLSPRSLVEADLAAAWDGSAGTNVATATTSSTTAAYLSLSTDILTLDAPHTAEGMTATPTIDNLSDADAVAVSWGEFVISVWGGDTAGATSIPTVHAVYAAEYLAP